LEQEIELRELLSIIAKRWKVIFLLFVLAVAGSAVFSHYVAVPVYQASTTLLMGKSDNGSRIVIQDVELNRQLAKTYGQIVKSSTVANAVIAELKLDMSVGELKNKITVAQVAGTDIISISVKDHSPARSAFLANEVARVFIRQLNKILNVDNVSVIDIAVTPAGPIYPRPMFNMAIASVLSLMLGFFIVFMLEYLDNTIKTPQDVEKYLGLPLLGTLPYYEGE
jgi:capsular polysaccharide biosynthesis protein